MIEAPGIEARLAIDYPGFTLDVDLQLPGRGVSVLFGPSGCGKTTVLRALAGLLRSRRGHVQINGEPWQDDATSLFVPPHRRALGYVFQEASLFAHLSVRGNIDYGRRRVPAGARRLDLDAAIELLGIAPLLERRPDGLSGGERQRVAIARALACSPRLLLMDEPLSALDQQRRGELLPYLQRLHESLQIPVVYVTHALDEVARLADHLVLLEAGRVKASGPAAELLTRLDLPLAQADAAGALVEATVIGHDLEQHVTQVSFAGGTLSLAHQPLPLGHALRLRVPARDVSLALSHHADTSVLNILPATVLALAEDAPGQVTVRLSAGGVPLLARVTRRSASALRLAPGMALYAQIKGVALG